MSSSHVMSDKKKYNRKLFIKICVCIYQLKNRLNNLDTENADLFIVSDFLIRPTSYFFKYYFIILGILIMDTVGRVHPNCVLQKAT